MIFAILGGPVNEYDEIMKLGITNDSIRMTLEGYNSADTIIDITVRTQIQGRLCNIGTNLTYPVVNPL